MLFEQLAARMPPPTTVRNAPAQAMKMAAPNSYLEKKLVSQTDELCQDDSIFRVHKGQFEIVMYILSVDRGERVVEGPDDVIRIPRAGNNGTQSCGRIHNIIHSVNLLKINK